MLTAGAMETPEDNATSAPPMKFVSRRSVLVNLGFLAILPLCAQEIDWASIVRDLTSTDSALREATFEALVDKIHPKLCKEEGPLLEAEIPGLVDQLSQKGNVARLQASGILYTIGQCRSDSEITLARAIPALVDHAKNDSFERIRGNSIRTLVDLKPNIPNEVFSFLVGVMKGYDDNLAVLATYGVARRASPGSEAEELLSEALSQRKSIGRKKAAINALLYGGVTDPLLMNRLGAVLNDPDPSVVKIALNVISHLGTRAIEPNRQQLSSLASSSQDAEIAAVAKHLAERDTSRQQ